MSDPTITKTKVKTSTKVGLVLIGAAIAAAVIVNYSKINLGVKRFAPSRTTTSTRTL